MFKLHKYPVKKLRGAFEASGEEITKTEEILCVNDINTSNTITFAGHHSSVNADKSSLANQQSINESFLYQTQKDRQ